MSSLNLSSAINILEILATDMPKAAAIDKIYVRLGTNYRAKSYSAWG